MRSVSRSLFYQSICLSFCQHWAALLTAAFTKSWHLVLSALFFKDALIILGPLHFHIHFRIRLSISKQPTRKEKPAGILVGITWNLETSAGRTDIFTTPSAGECVEGGHGSCTAGGRANWYHLWKTGSHPLKLNICLPCDLAIPFLGMNPTEHIHTRTERHVWEC